MSWVKLSTSILTDPDVVALEPPAFRAYINGLAYCGAHLTDGHLTTKALRVIHADRATADELVDAGLWVEVIDGWEVRNYLHHQRSRADVEGDRKRDARRKALHDNPELKEHIRLRDGDHCRYCGKAVKWNDRRSRDGATYDHVDPNGDNDATNLVVACRACNSAKGPRTPEQAGMKLLPERNQIGTSYEPDPEPVSIETEEKRREEKRSEQNTLDQSDGHGDSRPAVERVTAEEFGAWWSQYPRKVARQKAESSYRKARKGGVSAQTLYDGVTRSMSAWRAEGRPQDKIPHPTTWLNEGRWDDDYATPPPQPTDRRPALREFVARPDEPAWSDPAIPNHIAELRSKVSGATKRIDEVV